MHKGTTSPKNILATQTHIADEYGNTTRKFQIFFLVQCHHMSFVDFVVLPPGHGRSVTDFWGWDAREARLRCPDGVWAVIEDDVVPGGALNPNSTNLPRPWSPWESFPSRKIPTVEPGIFPFKENTHGRAGNRTRDLMISSQRLWPLDHEAGQRSKNKYSNTWTISSLAVDTKHTL